VKPVVTTAFLMIALMIGSTRCATTWPSGVFKPAAKDTGLGRESLYKALSDEGNPNFATILKVTRALRLRLHASQG